VVAELVIRSAGAERVRGFRAAASAAALSLMVAMGAAPASARQPAWTVAPAPAVSLGSGSSPHEEFFEVIGVLRLTDGSIVVANQSTNEVRFFTATGRHVRTTGRTGSGPGEFRSLSRVARAGRDTVVAWDWATRRATFINAKGSVVREVSLTGRGAPQAALLAVLSDGRFLGMRTESGGFPFEGREGESRQQHLSFLCYPAGGPVQWSSQRLVRNEVFGMPFHARNRSYMAPMELPFSVRATWAVYRDTLFYGTGEAYRFAVVAPDGRTVRWIGDDRPRRPLSSGAVAGFRQQVRSKEARGSGEVRSAFMTVLDRGRVPFPAQLPAHGAILMDALGYLWVQDPDAAGESYVHLVTGGGQRPGARTWTVLSRDGTIVQQVTMPAGLRVDDIGADYVLGVWRDDFDVEHVRLHALRR
jgi:hypothetical protein